MTERPGPQKSADAYRTIGEVADELNLPQHVLRFWETRFAEVKPLKRAGGRRFYRSEDIALLRAVQVLLYREGYTIKGVQRLLAEFGGRHVAEALARSAGEGGSGGLATGQGVAAMPTDDARPRRAAALPPSRPVPFPAVPDRGGPPPPARPETRGDVIRRLEAVLADLADCERLLASVRSR